ncbi:MAG: NAD(P)/FAD-dependent oxidoreductase [Proteobacteria bacterium]|nr:NAD(P)/FAD-dependent oxidoreductase [Pseudomonadota bacterium]
MKRRRLLGSAGALASTAALAACAVRPAATPSLGRVLVIGGGYGGCTAARYLKLWGGAAVAVTLVDPDEAFVSCPMSNLVLGGQRRMADITHGYDGLRAGGVAVRRDRAVAIDAAARRVRLAGGETLGYERLIVSPGIGFIPGAIAGLDTPAARQRVLHAWQAGPQTLALRRQIEALPDGGVVAITIPPSPYRCPPAPYERACTVAAWLKVHKPRAKLLLLDANPEIQSKKALFERAFKERYAGILAYHPSTELKEVDAAAGVLKFEFEDLKADVLNVVPPQRAADIAREAGLVNVAGRWAGVHWLTLESTAAAGVHVLGDTLFPAPAMPKSGHMANQLAKVCAAALIQLLKGEAVNPAPLVMNTCYSFVSDDEAMHIASVHAYDDAERTFKPVHDAGGLSAAPSRAEGRFAQAWAENIWADTLGGPLPR